MACDTPGEFYIDDTKIDSLEIDGQAIDFLEIDDICVWARLVPARLILDEVGTYEWDVVPGCLEVALCMVGGGGSGGTTTEDGGSAGGGYAGDIVDQSHSVSAGSTIAISVGSGAAGVYADANKKGNTGSDSSFDSVIASGGEGGTPGPSGDGYSGQGDERTTCGGTGHDGQKATQGSKGTWGGQSSGFGDGGDGAYEAAGGAGGIGSGGGSCTGDYTSNLSGNGGRGEVRFSWGDTSNPLFQEYTWSTMSQEDKDKLGIRKIS